MHILLVRFSSMGDVVLQTATVNWLRSLFGKNLRLTFLTSEEFVSLVDHHPEVDAVIGFNRKKGEKWKELKNKISAAHKENPIDLILDLHGTLRSFRLKCSFWYIPSLTVDKRRWERFFLTKLKSSKLKKFISEKIMGNGPQVERILKDLEWIMGDSRSVTRTKGFLNGPHAELTSLAKDSGAVGPNGSYVVLAPSASFEAKRWPVERFVALAMELLDKTGLDVVVLAGPQDDFCRAFDSIQSQRFHNLQGKTSLRESMSVLAKSVLCIGNDSGMNHITEAYGVPCVTIFGPTDPCFGFAPHGKSSVFLSKELWCKPCSTTGKKDCFRDRHYCMEMISVDEVTSEAMKILDHRSC